MNTEIFSKNSILTFFNKVVTKTLPKIFPIKVTTVTVAIVVAGLINAKLGFSFIFRRSSAFSAANTAFKPAMVKIEVFKMEIF